MKWVWDVREGVDISRLTESCSLGIRATDLIRESSLLLRQLNFDEALKKVNDADSVLNRLSKELSADLIFGNIKDVLLKQPFDHLIMIPHRWLHYVPFEILKAGNDAVPLGITFDISRSFSLRLVKIGVENRKKQIHEYHVSNSSIGGNTDGKSLLRALSIENPTGDLSSANEQTEVIMRTLAEAISRSSIKMTREPLVRLSISDATISNFRDLAIQSPWLFIHYAGHANFAGDEPMMSHLRLRDREFSAYQIWNEVAFKGCPMVYLCACETGFSDVREGDEAFGLIRALMLSGSTTIIASYWPVLDECACLYTQRFYESHLLDGTANSRNE